MAVAAGSTSGHFVSGETRLILIGKTGAGKSSTGNNIIRQPKFKVDFSASSITKSCEHFMFERFGKDILLVDCPGFFDTGCNQRSIEEELKKSIVLTSPGLHAILFVVGMGRFTEEEVTSVKRCLMFFGSGSKHQVIVIFTRKDELEKNEKSLKFFIDSHKELKSFIEETGRNYIAVNNHSTEDNEEFALELLGLVDRLRERNRGHFTNKMYQEAERQMRKIEGRKLGKLSSANKTSDEKAIADGILEYSHTLSDYSESQKKFLLAKRSQTVHDEYRQIHEKEARRLARDSFHSSDINWKELAG
ncbi:GTPase IMAP family member 4-like isoform X2 [Haliotis rufescens]|uniref:GTPase IMAP family member 4-like isoform X2 n=1 Tax=Haliotis rufescens TaxID=6454 RepID=UPI00201E98F7|nr:GTPase IMAP family member 4-like isoform X2 [Haliotis rufescens]XP_048236763.1 GTPase IMAP family member 4-like isoform X2 [Haliotis rufescens]